MFIKEKSTLAKLFRDLKMERTKFGLKIWSTNSDLLEKAKELVERDIFQYIELTPVPNTEIASFLESNLPYIIHITTERHGVNVTDKKKKQFNLRAVNNCIKWVDKLNAKYLIIHPGFGRIDDAIEFLNSINDKRILIENMPKVGLNNEQMIGYTPEQIKKLKGEKFGFCLDLNHAIKASISLNRNYKKFLNKFVELKPEMFHISDGTLTNEKDEHLNIGEGEYDFNFLINYIKKNESKYVTLETPRKELNSFDEDLKNLEKLLNPSITL